MCASQTTPRFKSQETTWSWVMVFACGMSVALSFSPSVSSGNFFVEWVHVFNVSRELASLPFSLNMGIMFMLVPVANMIAEKFSYRITIMVGSVTAALGLCLSSFATNIFWLIVTYGIITGCGYCLMLGPSVTVIPLIFDTHVIIAAGISSVFAGIGLTGLPYLFDVWISHLTWRFGLICLASLVLQVFALAALIFPTEIRQPKGKKKSGANICREVFSLNAICLYGATFLGVCPALIFSIVIPDHAVSRGLSAAQGSLVLTISGCGNLLGRISIVMTGQFTRGKSLLLIIISFGSRIAIALLPAITSFWPMAAIGLLIGLGWGFHAGVFATSISETFGLRLLPHMAGITFLMIGLSPYIALPFSAWIFSRFGSYDASWYIFGAMSGLAALLLVPLHIRKKTPEPFITQLHVTTDETRIENDD